MTSRIAIIVTTATAELKGLLSQGYAIESITAAGSSSPAWLVVLSKSA